MFYFHVPPSWKKQCSNECDHHVLAKLTSLKPFSAAEVQRKKKENMLFSLIVDRRGQTINHRKARNSSMLKVCFFKLVK